MLSFQENDTSSNEDSAETASASHQATTPKSSHLKRSSSDLSDRNLVCELNSKQYSFTISVMKKVCFDLVARKC